MIAEAVDSDVAFGPHQQFFLGYSLKLKAILIPTQEAQRAASSVKCKGIKVRYDEKTENQMMIGSKKIKISTKDKGKYLN